MNKLFLRPRFSDVKVYFHPVHRLAFGVSVSLCCNAGDVIRIAVCELVLDLVRGVVLEQVDDRLTVEFHVGLTLYLVKSILILSHCCLPAFMGQVMPLAQPSRLERRPRVGTSAQAHLVVSHDQTRTSSRTFLYVLAMSARPTTTRGFER